MPGPSPEDFDFISPDREPRRDERNVRSVGRSKPSAPTSLGTGIVGLFVRAPSCTHKTQWPLSWSRGQFSVLPGSPGSALDEYVRSGCRQANRPAHFYATHPFRVQCSGCSEPAFLLVCKFVETTRCNCGVLTSLSVFCFFFDWKDDKYL